MLEEFDKDENAYKEFVKRITVGIAQDDEIKILVLNSVIKDVATKNHLSIPFGCFCLFYLPLYSQLMLKPAYKPFQRKRRKE